MVCSLITFYQHQFPGFDNYGYEKCYHGGKLHEWHTETSYYLNLYLFQAKKKVFETLSNYEWSYYWGGVSKPCGVGKYNPTLHPTLKSGNLIFSSYPHFSKANNETQRAFVCAQMHCLLRGQTSSADLPALAVIWEHLRYQGLFSEPLTLPPSQSRV